MKKISFLLFASICLYFCAYPQKKTPSSSQAYVATPYDYPSPVDTKNKPITDQIKKTFDFEGTTFDNQFAGARLNHVEKIGDDTYRITILPENEPINSSPWYSFRLINDRQRQVTITLDYQKYKHRYRPKMSHDQLSWSSIDVLQGVYNHDSTTFTFKVDTRADTTYVSAQKLFTLTHLKSWINKLTLDELVKSKIIGKSVRGRDLWMLDLYKDNKKGKKLIVLLSRQHPPEVTGFFALQAFIDTIIKHGKSNGFFNEYRVIIYPMLNPDGVDLGHWRHNARGVDLNRDWAYYHQKETRSVANSIVKESQLHQNDIVLGFDFHSTYHDVFYTQKKEELKTPTTDWFRDKWFKKIEERIPGYKVNESPSGLNQPISKGWFYTQFGVESMTYEIGDNTPVHSINEIGRITGEEMMNILLQGE